MSKPLSSEAIWGMGASAALLVVVALGVYFYAVLAKTPAATPSSQTFNVGVLSEMQADGNQNIFLKVTSLHDVPQSTGDSVKYLPSDLGKTDLTKSE